MIDESTFLSEVRHRFGRVLSQHGYRLVASAGYSVRFGKHLNFVEVDYDAHRSTEVSIWVGDDNEAEPPLELVDALRATGCGPQALQGLDLMQTSDPDELGRMLRRACRMLVECGESFVAGDPSAFRAARALRSQRAKDYTRETRNRSTLERADVAWSDRDYGQVHDLLNPIRDSLDSKYRRRLEFAGKRL